MEVADAEAIYRLTSLAAMKERIVIPKMLREQALAAAGDVQAQRGEAGFGTLRKPKRRW